MSTHVQDAQRAGAGAEAAVDDGLDGLPVELHVRLLRVYVDRACVKKDGCIGPSIHPLVDRYGVKSHAACLTLGVLEERIRSRMGTGSAATAAAAAAVEGERARLP